MDQPALFLVEADEKLQSKLNSLPSEQCAYNLLSSFMVGFLFALRPQKNMDDFDYILNTASNLLDVKQSKKLTFSQFILVMEQIILQHSQDIQEIVRQESNKFSNPSQQSQQNKKQQIQIGSFQEEIQKVQSFFNDDIDLCASQNLSASQQENNSPSSSSSSSNSQNPVDIESQFPVRRTEQRRQSLIQRMSVQNQMQEILEETDDELGQLNEANGIAQKEFSNQKIGNCDICSTDIKLNQYQPLKCLHNFHRDCLAKLIIDQFESQKLSVIRCCIGACNQEISDQEIQETLPANKFQNYLDYRFDESSIGNSIIYCPSKHCNMRYQKEEDDLQFNCTGCSESYCLNCKTKWHPNISCNQFQDRRCKLTDADTKVYCFTKHDEINFIEPECPKCHKSQSVKSSDSIANCSNCEYTFWCSNDEDQLKYYEKGEEGQQQEEDIDQFMCFYNESRISSNNQMENSSFEEDLFQDRYKIIGLHDSQRFEQLQFCDQMKNVKSIKVKAQSQNSSNNNSSNTLNDCFDKGFQSDRYQLVEPARGNFDKQQFRESLTNSMKLMKSSQIKSAINV